MGMRRIAITVIMLAILFMLTGCTSIDNGTVVDKAFIATHRIYGSMIMRISDSWRILVENNEHKEWWDVTEEYYNSVNIGDYVDRKK